MKKNKFIIYIKIVIFLLILYLVSLYPKNTFDIIISDILTAIFNNNVFKLFGKTISIIFHDKFLLVLMGLLSMFLFVIKEYKKSIFIISTAFVGSVVTLLIKYLVGRDRPIPEFYSGGSFPSGHSVVIVLFFASLLFVINKKKIIEKISIFAIILVPFSRVIVGAHFITDVFGGLLLGSIIIDMMKVHYLKLYTLFSNITGLEDE